MQNDRLQLDLKYTQVIDFLSEQVMKPVKCQVLKRNIMRDVHVRNIRVPAFIFLFPRLIQTDLQLRYDFKSLYLLLATEVLKKLEFPLNLPL